MRQKLGCGMDTTLPQDTCALGSGKPVGVAARPGYDHRAGCGLERHDGHGEREAASRPERESLEKLCGTPGLEDEDGATGNEKGN